MNWKAAFSSLRLTLLVTVASCLIAVLTSCGGGSSGTGVSVDKRSFEGRAVTSNDEPVAGALVTLLNTGEFTTSKEDGRFFLPSDFSGPTADLEVRTDKIRKTFTVPNIENELSGVQLTIVLDQNEQTVSVSSLEVSVQVRGNCDYYFENSRIIRQANRLDDGTVCSLRVEIHSAGSPLTNAPFRLERRRCLNGAPWHLEAVGLTGTTIDPADASRTPVTDDSTDASRPDHPGIARLPFTFFNDESHCVYRIVAPDLPGVDPVLYEIHTFRKQDFDSAK